MGVVIDRESILSSTPPCPGIAPPISLTPMSLLIADTMTSPMNPTPAIKKLTSMTSSSDNGVKKRMRYPITIEDNNPPKNPSQVLFGLILGSILFLPNNLPHTNCITSFICVMKIRNSKSPFPPAAKPSMDGRLMR